MAQLLSNLPIGAKVKFGKHKVGSETPWDIIWLVVAKSHVGYPANSVTLLTEKIIDEKPFDAKEPNNPDEYRKGSGNNKYSVSNIDQWLNSSASTWFTKKHDYDTPPSAEYLNSSYASLAYDNRDGFLYNFSTNERRAILDTTIRNALPALDGGGYHDFVRKVFLPSIAEIAGYAENGIYEGSKWEWFTSNPSLKCALYSLTINNIVSPEAPSNLTDYNWIWHTRTPNATANGAIIRDVSYDGSLNTTYASTATIGVRPTINLSSTLKVSDTTDSDGCYTFILNSAPPKPTTITLPSKILGGKANTISWSSVTDSEGDAVTYQLECSYDNGGTYSTIYAGTAISYVHIPTYGKTTIIYRVKAIDTLNESSAYTTSANVTVINNNAPVISGSDSNLGVKSSGFSGTYTITDANNDAVTVTESIDGVQIRSLVATLGATITYGIKGNTWLALPNGSHTFTIRATDGIDTSVRTYTFTKLIDSFTIQNSTPWHSENMPTRIMIVVTRNIPATATFKVEVCNNGYDDEPYWEDATPAVKSGLVHVFENESAENDWGVLIRVTVDRNGATGACYVSAIGGNFE